MRVVLEVKPEQLSDLASAVSAIDPALVEQVAEYQLTNAEQTRLCELAVLTALPNHDDKIKAFTFAETGEVVQGKKFREWMKDRNLSFTAKKSRNKFWSNT